MAGFRNILRGRDKVAEGVLSSGASHDLDPAALDPTLAALAEELSSLGDAPIPAAARARSLALVRQEFQKQERRGAFGRSTAPGLLFRGRLALGSVAVVLAAFLGLVGLYGEPGAPQWAGTDVSSPGSSSVSPGTSGSEGTSIPGSTDTTFVNGSTTEPSDPVTTGMTPPTDAGTTTATPGSTQTISPPSSSSSPSSAPSSTGVISRPTTTAAPTPTTSGSSTNTTARQVMTSEQRESSARSAATRLADKVVLDDLDGAASVLAPGAGSDFTQMVSSLSKPYGYRVVSVSDGSLSRVLMEFLDEVQTVNGPEKTTARFYFDIDVDEAGALVTAIYKAPAR